MYRVTGWTDGEPEVVYVETWEDVLSIMYCLETGMYRAVLVVNAETGVEVVSFSFA